MTFFADAGIAEADAAGAPGAAIAAHLARLDTGDYFAINAYRAACNRTDAELQALRQAVRDRRHVATGLGYGPRFLHSTGQLHKGGPNQGVFLQVTCDEGPDLAIPGRGFSFGVLNRAQAQGDFQVLAGRGRRILWVHLDPGDGVLAALRERVEAALGER